MKSQAIACSKYLNAKDLILLFQLLLVEELQHLDQTDEQAVLQLFTGFSYLDGAERYIKYIERLEHCCATKIVKQAEG